MGEGCLDREQGDGKPWHYIGRQGKILRITTVFVSINYLLKIVRIFHGYINIYFFTFKNEFFRLVTIFRDKNYDIF